MQLKIGFIVLSLLTALNAKAINCSKASTAIEKAICGSESHLADDQKIGVLFNEAKKATQYPDNVIRSQLAWVEKRNKKCNQAQDIDNCIATSTGARISEFSIDKGSRSNLPLVRILGTSYSKDDVAYLTYNFSYLLLSPADTPQKITINHLLEKSFDPGKNPLNKLPNISDSSEACDQDTQYTDQRLLFLSTKYLAIYSGEDSMVCGAAHPNRDGYNLHFNMAAGKPLTYPDVFTKKSIIPLMDICIRDIVAKRANPESDYRKNYGDSIKNGFESLGFWSFSENGATIQFPPDVAGIYAEGFTHCEFSREQISSYLTDSFMQLLQSPKL